MSDVPNDNNEASKQCNAVIERYRTGSLAKVDAVLELHRSIPRTEEATDEQFRSALQAYLSMLDDADKLRDSAAKRGDAPPGREDGAESEGGDIPPEDEHNRKRRRTGSDSESDTEDLGAETVLPKSLVDESKLPWVIDEQLHPVELSSSLRLTRDSLRLWSTNPKRYKASLVNAVRCPEFPDSEWTNIIEGKPINLDVVFAGHYSTSYDQRHIEKLGSIELSFASAKPSKHVRTIGDWVIAYGTYITGLFGAIHESLHYRVIEYDKAVRKYVSARRDRLLTDTTHFSNLYQTHISSSGAAVLDDEQRSQTKQGRSGDSRKRNSRAEACRRWNEGRCPMETGRCRYLHACSFCRSRDHTAEQCVPRPRGH